MTNHSENLMKFYVKKDIKQLNDNEEHQNIISSRR
jgi:hypothetical protein